MTDRTLRLVILTIVGAGAVTHACSSEQPGGVPAQSGAAGVAGMAGAPSAGAGGTGGMYQGGMAGRSGLAGAGPGGTNAASSGAGGSAGTIFGGAGGQAAGGMGGSSAASMGSAAAGTGSGGATAGSGGATAAGSGGATTAGSGGATTAGSGGNTAGRAGGGQAGVAGASGKGGEGGTLGGGGAGGGAGSVGGFTCAPACGAGDMCCPQNALETACVSATTQGCEAPDLTIDADRAEETAEVEFANFGPDHCAIAEQCVDASGRRRLLRFETFTPNIGTADMVLGEPDTSNPVFEYSACHDHFHFKGYAEYDLLAEDGTVVAQGHKQAFCLLDSERVRNDASTPRFPQYRCENQGITRGWGDSYTPDLDCQWVDVTDVPPGDYQLRIRINQGHTLQELRYDNNEAIVPVTIP